MTPAYAVATARATQSVFAAEPNTRTDSLSTIPSALQPPSSSALACSGGRCQRTGIAGSVTKLDAIDRPDPRRSRLCRNFTRPGDASPGRVKFRQSRDRRGSGRSIASSFVTEPAIPVRWHRPPEHASADEDGGWSAEGIVESESVLVFGSAANTDWVARAV